jgi:peptide chain release factor subunit 1
MKSAGRLASDLSRRIRTLAEIRVDEPVVLSMYVNLDPGEFATPKDRESQIESLIDQARSDSAVAALSHESRTTLDADFERVKAWTKSSMDPAGAHGVAVFCCSSADLFEFFRLSAAVGPKIHVGEAAYLEPLTSAMPGEAWCVFLVNRRTNRILRGSRDRLVEGASFEDDVHGQHDQGGWSQARYQRSVEKEVSDHVQNACDRLFEAFNRVPFDKLLVGCPPELWPEVETKLHSYLSERVVERFDAEVEHEGLDDVLERVRPLIEQDERREETRLVDRLAEQLGRKERAASGLGSVLEALNANRVEVLFLSEGLEAPGVACPRCGWIGTDGTECPVDGAALEGAGDIIDKAIQKSVLQSASVHRVRYHEPERALGGPIAALLRF